MTTKKTPRAETTKMYSYSFYYKNKEYIIEAKDQNEARTLFKQLIKSS